ncbi:MAG TPA: hypothetical protein VM680_18595 [Verrucomicrobiae bacterium]|nr:hypothetical protein [Verrucomicrobiae bacterium]
MSRINIRLNEIITTPANVAVTIRSVLVDGQSVVSGNYGILPATWVVRTDETGLAFQFLKLGRYEITAKSAQASDGAQYRVLIDVPEDNNTYEHTALIVEGADGFTTPAPTVVPNASDVVYGLVKTNTASGTPTVYRKEEIDAGLGSGLYLETNVAALQLVAKHAANKVAVLTEPGAGEATIWIYDAASVLAHNGLTVVEGTGVGAGRWLPLEIH